MQSEELYQHEHIVLTNSSVPTNSIVLTNSSVPTNSIVLTNSSALTGNNEKTALKSLIHKKRRKEEKKKRRTMASNKGRLKSMTR
ncbi:hypothetical protein HC752_05025 [Vibrio sp. S9_S30]|uniref:hypothetical protein n=1 Tax=Vibrio sp. S9_S30 TaxID=2720226 RepID=UPI001680AD5F|nr:hypothetical protein [Vibrio sp. S9_S30]MBD1556293.1 hypothetical protein [Vibrio sp. S9_S30]